MLNKRKAAISPAKPSGLSRSLGDAAPNEEQSVATISSFQRWLERILLFLAIIGTAAVIHLYSSLYFQVKRHLMTEEAVYGRWLEHNVASYNQEELIFSAQGVHRNGVLIATKFDFDGKNITYKVSNRERHYQVMDDDLARIQQQGSAFYQPVFIRVKQSR